MKFVYIKPGTFEMGIINEPSASNSKKIINISRKVTLTKGFYIQNTETTVGQWKKFVGETKYNVNGVRSAFELYHYKSQRNAKVFGEAFYKMGGPWGRTMITN